MKELVVRGIHVETLEEILLWLRNNLGEAPIHTETIRHKYNETMPKVSPITMGWVIGALGYSKYRNSLWIMKKVYEFEVDDSVN